MNGEFPPPAMINREIEPPLAVGKMPGRSLRVGCIDRLEIRRHGLGRCAIRWCDWECPAILTNRAGEIASESPVGWRGLSDFLTKRDFSRGTASGAASSTRSSGGISSAVFSLEASPVCVAPSAPLRGSSRSAAKRAPSVQAARASVRSFVLVREKVFKQVPHRHVVFTL